MRKLLMIVVAVPTLLFGAMPLASAAPPDQQTHAMSASSWLIDQVTPHGTILSTYTGNPDLGTMRQAVLALASAGVGEAQVDAMMTYLEANLEAGVDPQGAAASDVPGALAQTILDAVATGHDPRAFGGTDLVARLEATQRPSGLFGLADQDPTYDGTVRQSLALMALATVGVTNAPGTTWLLDQQCADGSYVAYRADTSVPCPAVDATSYTGSDTNSTSFAALALHTLGDQTEAAQATTWLRSVRSADGGFPYYGDPTQPSDANSTGLTLLALTNVDGAPDAQAVQALAALQVPCDGPALDVGGIAFQATDGPPLPDLLATVQALQGLAGGVFPLRAEPSWVAVVDVCAPEPTPTTAPPTTAAASPTSLAPAALGATPTTVDPNSESFPTELAQTGGGVLGLGDLTVAGFAVLLLLCGGFVVVAARRASTSRP